MFFRSGHLVGVQSKRCIHPELVNLLLGLHSHTVPTCKSHLKGRLPLNDFLKISSTPTSILLALGSCCQQKGDKENPRTSWSRLLNGEVYVFKQTMKWDKPLFSWFMPILTRYHLDSLSTLWMFLLSFGFVNFVCSQCNRNKNICWLSYTYSFS